MMRVWRAWRDGHMPDPGGSLDQAVVMVEALAVMDTAFAELQDGPTP